MTGPHLVALVARAGSTRLRTVAGLFAFAWCLPAFVGGYALLTMFEFHALEIPGFTPAVHEGLARLLLDPWQHWDGQWFLRIAEDGYYRGDPSAAFLPLYPWLVRTLTVLTSGDHLLAACLVSWASLAGGLWLLHGLLLEELGEAVAVPALVLLVAFPTALFFHAAYSESLFLLLTVATFVAARRGLWLVAGGAALGATLTRWTGFGLVPVLVVEAWWQAVERRAKEPAAAPAPWARLFSREGLQALRGVSPLALVSALLPAAALPFVLWTLDRAVGDPWAFSRAQRLWERRVAPPWTGLIDGVRVLLPGHPPYLEPLPGGFPRLEEYPGGFLTAHAYNLVAAVGGLALAVVALRRLRPAYGAWALVGVVIPLMTPSRLQPLQSMPRFLVVLFPLFAALALLLRARPLATTYVVATFAAIQGFFIARFALWFWVA